MNNPSALKKITDEISLLSKEEKQILLKKLTVELGDIDLLSSDSQEIKDIYGLGHGLWGPVDAQEYVESLRRDRE